MGGRPCLLVGTAAAATLSMRRPAEHPALPMQVPYLHALLSHLALPCPAPQTNRMLHSEVTEADIAEIVSKWTGIPVSSLKARCGWLEGRGWKVVGGCCSSVRAVCFPVCQPGGQVWLGRCFDSISRSCGWVAAPLAAMHPVLNRPCPLSLPPTMQ